MPLEFLEVKVFNMTVLTMHASPYLWYDYRGRASEQRPENLPYRINERGRRLKGNHVAFAQLMAPMHRFWCRALHPFTPIDDSCDQRCRSELKRAHSVSQAGSNIVSDRIICTEARFDLLRAHAAYTIIMGSLRKSHDRAGT